VTRAATAQERSRDALASVFLASYGDCLRFALGMLGDRVAGEEAVQDAFLRLWSKPPLLDDPLAAKAYVFRTIVNMGRSRQRRDAHRWVLEPAVPAGVDETDVALSIDIRAALQALPTRRRACVLMRYVLDYTERETADALQISIGTVKSQTHKALRQLREPLAGATGREGVASHESGS
jgi:RNA polymerase sigma factor (sigma-70 family)